MDNVIKVNFPGKYQMDFVSNLDEKLTSTDREKLTLVAMEEKLIGEQITCQHLIKSADINVIDCLSEAFYLIARYDLLRCLQLCEVVVGKRFKNTSTAGMHFDPRSTLLLKIYNAITRAMETDFRKQFEVMRPDVLSREQNQSIDSHQNLTLAEIILICVKHPTAWLLFRNVFETLGWNTADVLKVSEIPDGFRVGTKVSVYPMNQSPCGRCIIINNEYVKNQDRRTGSEIDEKAMAKIFKNFDFDVEIYRDLTHESMVTLLESVASYNHSKYCAFVCIIMSHGSQGIIKSSDDQSVSINYIVNMFSGAKCYSLFGKPKLFIIQACQGESFLLVKPNSTELEMDGPSREVSVIDRTIDYLLGMPTLDGCGALRDPNGGSLFIQALAEAFEKYDDMADVKPYVASLVRSKILTAGDKFVHQVPIWKDDTLSKRLIFRKKSEI